MADDPLEVFKSIAANSPMVVMLLNLDHTIRFINRTANERTPAALLGKPVYDFIPPDQHEQVKACLARVVESRAPGEYENTRPSKDGLPRVWRSHVSPLLTDGEMTGFVVFSSDVTQDRVATLAQQRCFALSLDALLVATMDGSFVEVSDSLATLLGYSRDELLSHPFLDLIHPDDVEAGREQLARLREGRDVIDYENRYRRADGSYVTMQWRATSDLESGHIFAVGRDVTETRRVETRVRQSQRMEAVGQLAGSIAHDFNNLLLAIHGNVEFALESAPPEQREFLEHIQQASTRAAELTRQLLTFSRQKSAVRRDVQLNDIARQLMSLLSRLIPADIEVEFIAGHQLALIDGNEAQLEQVLLNLVLNGRDAMPDGGRLTIETENVLIDSEFVQTHPWAEVGRYVLVCVSDTGTGMPPEVQERAFEPFFTTKPPDEGTGLGLATVYGIVQQHDGFAQIYSEPDAGTTMKVYLPATARNASDIGDKITSEPNGDREVVLLSEDQELVRDLVEKILDKGGYEVALAENGYEALRLLRADPERYACLLLDVVTPEMSGAEAYERIREVRPGIPVVFMSGYTEASRSNQDTLKGHRILTKPFKSSDLLKRVRQAISGEEE